MKVELFPPDSETEPRHWVRHDQAFAMMLGPGSIEWGSKRSALEKFAYRAGDLALCDRHQGEWVGLMNVPHLQLGISDAALMAASDEPNGEVELRPHRKFADSRLGALATLVHSEMVGGFPSGRLFLDSIEQAMAVALVSGQAVRHQSCADIRRRTRPMALAKDNRPGPCQVGRRVGSRRVGASGRIEHGSFRADVSQINRREPSSICSATKA